MTILDKLTLSNKTKAGAVANKYPPRFHIWNGPVFHLQNVRPTGFMNNNGFHRLHRSVIPVSCVDAVGLSQAPVRSERPGPC